MRLRQKIGETDAMGYMFGRESLSARRRLYGRRRGVNCEAGR